MKWILIMLAIVLILSVGLDWFEQSSPLPQATDLPTAARGEVVITTYGCGSCHTIPGIRGANGLVGPSLDRIASRTYIAGVLTNSPENLQRWIRNPPAIDKLTAMPNLQIPERDINAVVAYLETLR